PRVGPRALGALSVSASLGVATPTAARTRTPPGSVAPGRGWAGTPGCRTSGRDRHLRRDELEESAIHFIRMRPADVVGAALDGDECAIGDQRRQARGGR